MKEENKPLFYSIEYGNGCGIYVKQRKPVVEKFYFIFFFFFFEGKRELMGFASFFMCAGVLFLCRRLTMKKVAKNT